MTTLDDLDTRMAAAMSADDWATAEQIGAEADSIPRPAVPDLLTAALYYASLGMRVFPLQPNSKIPYGKSNGCKDATSDPDRIRDWWTKAPASNLGIATGHLVDVIDLDGLPGVLSFSHMEGLPPVIGRARTVRPGGWHLFIRSTGIGNRAGVLPGIDIRGDGGYVVAAPSVINGRMYRWVDVLNLGSAVAA
jgi:hypothetical protein